MNESITIRGIKSTDKERLQVMAKANGYETLSEFLRDQLQQVIQTQQANALQSYLGPALSEINLSFNAFMRALNQNTEGVAKLTQLVEQLQANDTELTEILLNDEMEAES
ncbi:hypothetical protein [Furfurilactobacillus entadae]|uniref:hypothetical protein n=1 Tax=Furfurilactobacillus entadae TaxID=2922307 RepID=UPI0038B31157